MTQTTLKDFRERHATVLKLTVIIVLSLLFLIPLGMIRSLVTEREAARYFAVEEVISLWGGRQTVAGPILAVPYFSQEKTEEKESITIKQLAFFLPERLDLEGNIETETRKRGIYDVHLYTSELTMKGTFRKPDFSGWGIRPEDIQWEESFLLIEFFDLRGLTDPAFLEWEDRKGAFVADTGKTGVFTQALTTPVVLEKQKEGVYEYGINLRLRGGETLRFLPLGDTTRASLTADWPSPRFNGAYLPDTHSIDDSGFTASWNVLSIGRNIPGRWLEGEPVFDPYVSAFGVDFITPVDTYLKNTRSIKYGILFIVLPFFAFFLFEIFMGKPLHPMQYLLTGLAECVFYLLLLSLSEHIGFGPAYAAAGAATTGLVTLYSAAVLTSPKRAGIIALILGSCYLFLYVILLSQDYALLIVSIGLFAILTTFMIFTRKINWYDMGGKGR